MNTQTKAKLTALSGGKFQDRYDYIKEEYKMERHTISGIMATAEGQLLQNEFDELVKTQFNGVIPKPLGMDKISNWDQYPDQVTIADVSIEYVMQRWRLGIDTKAINFTEEKDRKRILKMIKDPFNFVFSGIPVVYRIKGKIYAPDFQKRFVVLNLLGIKKIPAVIIDAESLEDLMHGFDSQFQLKDNMDSFTKFRLDLLKGKEYAIMFEKWFRANGVTLNPQGPYPIITDFTQLKRGAKEVGGDAPKTADLKKKLPILTRAVNVYNAVWPMAPGECRTIPGAFITGLASFIRYADEDILSGADRWLVHVLEQAKNVGDYSNGGYECNATHDKAGAVTGYKGYKGPGAYTKGGWQGNMGTKQPIIDVASVWNKVHAGSGVKLKQQGFKAISQVDIDTNRQTEPKIKVKLRTA